MSITRSPGRSGCAMRSASSTAGGRVLVSVLGQPFDRRPFEGSLHAHATGDSRRRTAGNHLPMQRPVPVATQVSQMFRDGLAARGMELPQQLVTSLDPGEGVARLSTGETLRYDLLGIPVHRAPEPLAASGLAVNGGCPSTRPISGPPSPTCTPSVMSARAHGPSPRPGSSLRRRRASWPTTSWRVTGQDPPAPYEGSGVCYAEFGGGLVSKVEVNFLRGDSPSAERQSLGRVRRREGRVRGRWRARWFGA